MSFLKKFGKCLFGFSKKPQHNSNAASTSNTELGPIRSDENVGPFVSDRRHVSKEGKPKPAAFKPNSTRRDLSAVRTDGTTNAELISTFKTHVDRAGKRELMGCAITKPENYLKHKLKIVADGHPYVRHANIVDWPTSESETKMITAELAANCDYVKLD